MPVTLSPLAGAGQQFFDNNGNPLTGGKLYTYLAGSTTPAVTYTTVIGNVAHANPIILDSAGRVPSGGEIWLTLGVGYKFVLTTSADVVIGTYDNIPSSAPPAVANDADSIQYEQGFTVTAGGFVIGRTYRILTLGDTNFTLIGATSNTIGLHFIATGAGTGTGTAEYTRTVETKLREIISVKDFGAVGDGVADDTAAVQAALTAANGRTLYAPAGIYRITSTITSYNQSLVKRPGVRIIGDGPDVTVFDNRVASGYCFDFNHSVGSTTYGNQVWSDGSTISELSIIGNASVANSSGIKIRGLWSLVFDRVVIKNHTLYGFHADVDTAYNPDMTASVNLAFVSTAISYNKIGIYAPQNQAIPNCSCKNVYVMWNTDAGIIVSSGLFIMSNCGVGFNGYAYSGDFTPSLSYGGFINPLVSDGCPSGIIIKGCEFDGNKPQQIYSAISSGMQVKNCRFGVRREDGELNKYMVVFGANTTVSVFRCYDATLDQCEINFKGADYAGVTVRPIHFNTYCRYGRVGTNQYFSTATNLTPGTNLFYVTENARTGGDAGPLFAVKSEFQNAVSDPLAYDLTYLSGFVYTMPQDSVFSFRPTFTGGVIIVTGGSSFAHGVIGYQLNAGSLWEMTVLPTGVVLTTGVLTGTTGTANRLNISCTTAGVIYVENRFTSPTQICVKTLPASNLYV